jgi:hypothetical protein
MSTIQPSPLQERRAAVVAKFKRADAVTPAAEMIAGRRPAASQDVDAEPVAPRTVSQHTARFRTDTSTNGGSRETDRKAFAVMPFGPFPAL